MDLKSNRPPRTYLTSRLLVRRQEIKDADQLFEAARESITEVFEFLSWCHPNYVLDDALEWLDHASMQWDTGAMNSFGIYTKSGRYLGGCGLNRIDDHPTANLGYWIRTSETNKGYATEAAQGLIEYGFRHLNLLRIEIIMSTDNKPSRVVAEKSGGLFEGILKNRLFVHNIVHDAYLYALTPG